MVSAFLVNDLKVARAYVDAEGRELRFLFSEAICHRIFVFLLMFFEIAHIEILFVTSFHLTDVFFTLLFVFEVDLHVLLQVRCCCK